MSVKQGWNRRPRVGGDANEAKDEMFAQCVILMHVVQRAVGEQSQCP